MNKHTAFEGFEVGYDIPALPGMDEKDIQTPCLILDLDALERNIVKMGDYAKAHGMRHRVHGKMHKSVDVAKLQEKLGGAVGVCCQKVSRGRGLRARRHQGRAGVEPGARPGQDRPARADAEARRADDRLRRRPRQRGRPVGGGGEARHDDRVPRRDRLRRGALRGHDDAGGGGDRQGHRRGAGAEVHAASRPTRARCSTWTTTRTARPRSRLPSRR